MLIKFSVKNYLSFKDLTTLELLSSSISQHKENVISKKIYKLLKSIAIFGPNASGKSNFFKAINFAKNFILDSAKETQANENIDVYPFLLSTETEKEPSLFEFVFIENDIKYRYGFILSETEILEEWLFSATKIKESCLFVRNKQQFDVGPKFSEGKNFVNYTRNNALFLSVVAQFNGEISMKILKWFSRLNVITGLASYLNITINYIRNSSKNENDFMKILNIADPSIIDINFEELNMDELPDFVKNELVKAKKLGVKINLKPEIKSIRYKYDKMHNKVSPVGFDFDKFDSKGTQNLFSLIGPILDTIESSGVLFIDELESNLHPLITRFLIKLFHLKNEKAQFVFNTHDTNLLSNKYFRRDQIYFMDKNRFGESSLTSLYDYDVRYDRTFEKDYLQGLYKAVPFINEYGILFNNNFLDEGNNGDR